MRYFTPERYARLSNLNSREAFLAAQEEWEQAVAAYKQHLRSIREKLPIRLRRLIETVYLHDARVLDMWWGGKTRFTITLQPESDPSRLVVLAYSLLAPPELDPEAIPDELRSSPAAWLYDELNVSGNGRAKGTAFTHDILLSDGREVRLRFRNVLVNRPIPLVPAVGPAPTVAAGVAPTA
jgi:hypothetical protein